MANILDFLATKAPQNYVQPMDIQPSYADLYAANPTPEVVPTQAQAQFDPSTLAEEGMNKLNRYTPNVAQMLTPTVAPMESGEITPTPNPNTANPSLPKAPVQIPQNLLQLSQSKYPFSGEADRAINLAGKAAADFAKNAPARPVNVGDYSAPIARAQKGADELSKQIGVYEQENQNIVNELALVNDQYIQKVQKTNEDFLQRSQAVSKQIDETVNAPVDTTIDPQRFWKNASTGSLIALAIGSVFAAMNPQSAQAATNTIMKAIDNDIDAQKQTSLNKMQAKRDKVSSLNDEFSRIKEMTGSDLAAQEVKRAQKFNFASVMLQQQANKLTNKTALNNAQNAITTLQMEAMKSQQAATNAAIEHNDRLAAYQLDASQKQAQFMLEKAKLKSSERIAGSGVGIGMALPQLTIEENIRMGAIPKEQRNEAIKELGIAKGADAMLKATDTYFNRVISDHNDNWTKQNMPYTSSNTYRKLGSAFIWNTGAELVKGAVQQHEYEGVIVPFLPEWDDTQAQIETKRAGLKNALANMMIGKMPTLSTYGVDVNRQFPSINKAIVNSKGE
jgi:hypothetical protein